MTHATLDPRALQDGQAPCVLSPWFPVLSHGLTVQQRVETIRLLHVGLAQLPRPRRWQVVILSPGLPQPASPVSLASDAMLARLGVAVVGLLGVGLWLLLR